MSTPIQFVRRTLGRPSPIHSKWPTLLRLSSTFAGRRFIPSQLSGVEYAEDYRPGGFHPMTIGDTFSEGRYRIIHKLGFGSSSTVWLARDERHHPGRLVTLKAMRADSSSTAADEIPEILIPKSLQSASISSSDFQAVDEIFLVRGPNGLHQFLVFLLAGPSILALSESPGQVSSSRRLRGDLAKSVAKQTATALYCMHRAGFVHGDLTTANILFRVSEDIPEWSDEQVYSHFGLPETEEIRTCDGQPRGPHAPKELVAPISSTKLADASLLQEKVVIIDFGQSYAIAHPPQNYQPATVINYCAPEMRFEKRTGFETDVWALGCAIFEICAGFPLFDPFLGSDADVLRQTVETLGKLPEPWWMSFAEQALWFDEDGEPKSEKDQKLAGALLCSSKSSIREKLRSIGARDDLSDFDQGPMMEKPGVRLCEEELEVLGDLLERMLRLHPEERIRMPEVVEHPWFAFRGS
ncbi:kinase-like protein [Dentipellis sp. KUC8613]|nr:kinase-like protein [Dentipellis sp. KUC8613]